MCSIEYRNYCKYHFGCALRASQDEFFSSKLREIFLKYDYHDRLNMMIFIDVTSTFDRPTMTEYLFLIKNHFEPLGFVLTNSEDVKLTKSRKAPKAKLAR